MSRPTSTRKICHPPLYSFGRIVESGRRKIADAIVSGKAIRIEGGEIDFQDKWMYHCYDCHHSWRISQMKEGCPHCRSLNIFYIEENGTPSLRKFREMG